MRTIFESSTFVFSKNRMVECVSSTCDYAHAFGYSNDFIQWVGQKELHMSTYAFDTYLTVFASDDAIKDTMTSCLEYKILTFGDIFKP